MKSKERAWFSWSALFLGVVIFDVLIKDFFLKTKASYDLGIFWLHLVTNTGASFGMLKQYNVVLSVLSIIVLAGILIYFRKAEKKVRPCLVLIAAGTLGNLVNRVMYGFVVDFIDFKFFPVFNIADMAIFFGVAGFAYILIREK
jgi:signal peptidase II